MPTLDTITRLAPLVRILLYAITGWLGGSVIDPETVQIIRTDPELLMLVTGGIAAVWYGVAKWRGWAT